MNTKEEKVKDINKAIKNSTVAMRKGVKAEVLKDGRIEYTEKDVTRSGREYRVKITFMKVLSYLQGSDMRKLKVKYGR